MKQVLDSRRSVIALGAVLVLVVHAFVSAWAGAAMAAQPMYDAFGNPLCITNIVSDDGSTGGDHGKLPNCCVFGCAVASAAVAAPHETVIETLAPTAATLVFQTQVVISAPRVRPGGQGSPRAPPSIV